MSLKIPPNTRISVDSLVREFGISQTPIREALSMLEPHGLVTKQRFIGTRSMTNSPIRTPNSTSRSHAVAATI